MSKRLVICILILSVVLGCAMKSTIKYMPNVQRFEGLPQNQGLSEALAIVREAAMKCSSGTLSETGISFEQGKLSGGTTFVSWANVKEVNLGKSPIGDQYISFSLKEPVNGRMTAFWNVTNYAYNPGEVGPRKSTTQLASELADALAYVVRCSNP